MDFILENIHNESRSDEIKAILQSRNLSEIVKKWVNSDNDLVILSGDENGRKQVYLLFESRKQSGKEVACAYCFEEQIINEHPVVMKLIGPPVVSPIDDRKSDKSAEDFYESSKSALKYSWNQDLCDDVYDLDSAVLAGLGVALGENGETTFSRIRPEHLEDTENAEYYRDNFLSVTSIRSCKDGIFSELSFSYADTAACSAGSGSAGRAEML